MKLFSSIVILLSLGFILSSCSEDEPANISSDGFPRDSLLINLADNYIIPNYQELSANAAQLNNDAKALKATPADTQALSNVRASLLSTWNSFNKVDFLEFGPANDHLLKERLGTWPTDTTYLISATAANGSMVFDRNPYKGLPALDFLLNGPTAESRLQNEPNTSQAILLLATEVDSLIQLTYDNWKADGGNYRNTFISNLGLDVGSSIGELLNSYVRNWEKTLRNFRIGFPAGLAINNRLDGPSPSKVEMPYGKSSLMLAKTSASAFQSVFIGSTMEGNNGPGFDDYLNSIDAKDSDGNPLSETIKKNFDLVNNEFNTINGPLYDAVSNQGPALESTFNAIQNQIRFLKVDMLSSMGVQITYADNDGD